MRLLLSSTSIALAAFCSGACVLTSSFGDYVTTGAPLYGVHGTVSGLDADDKVTLRLNGAQQAEFSNGDFAFDAALDRGSAYEVLAIDGTTHACVVEQGKGQIATDETAGDVSNVSVRCQSGNAALSDLRVSAGVLEGFASDRLAYDVVASQIVLVNGGSTAITAVTQSTGATITVGARPLASGVREDGIAYEPGVPLDVTVKAASGAEKHYAITFRPTFRQHENGAVEFSGAAGVVVAVAANGAVAFAGAGGMGTAKGAIYQLVRATTGWNQAAPIAVAAAGEGARLGTAVATSADGAVLAAGAPATDASVTKPAVYLFARAGATVTPTQSLGGADAQCGATAVGDLPSFGATLSLSADGNQLAVGAPAAGIVCIFTRTGTTWSTAGIALQAPQPGSQFGSALSINGDGTMLAIGAPGTAGKSGFVRVVTRAESVWTPAGDITLGAASPGELQENGALFGSAVALRGDTLVVGAKAHSRLQPDGSTRVSGSVSAFTRNGTGWTGQLLPLPDPPTTDGLYGASVAVGPGTNGVVIAVGAPGDSSPRVGINASFTQGAALGSGATFVLRSNGTSWNQVGYVKRETSHANDAVGGSVALSEEGTLVVGATNAVLEY